MDCDNARPATLTAAKAIPDGYEIDAAQHALTAAIPPIGISLASFLYENEVEPARCSKSPPNSSTAVNAHASSAAAEGAHGVGAVRQSRSCCEPSRNRPAVLGMASVGDLSRERGSGLGPSLIPARAPTSTASLPCTQKRVGAEASGDGIPPLLI